MSEDCGTAGCEGSTAVAGSAGVVGSAAVAGSAGVVGSPKTAEHHVGRILGKLGLRSRAEAASYVLRGRG